MNRKTTYSVRAQRCCPLFEAVNQASREITKGVEMNKIENMVRGKFSSNGDCYQTKWAGETLMVGLQTSGCDRFIYVADISPAETGFEVAWKLDGNGDRVSAHETQEEVWVAIQSAANAIDIDG